MQSSDMPLLHPQSIVILDFGGQYAHLIGNRVRRLGAFSEIHDPETPASELKDAAGIILSGGPQSVYDPKSPEGDPKIFDLGIPILGLCHGHPGVGPAARGGSSTRRSPTQNTERKSFSASLIFALLRSGSSRMSLRIWNGKSGGKQKAAMFLSSFPAESIPPLPSHSSTKYLELNASMVSSSITGSCAKVKFMKLPIPSPSTGSRLSTSKMLRRYFLRD